MSYITLFICSGRVVVYFSANTNSKLLTRTTIPKQIEDDERHSRRTNKKEN